MLSVAGIARGVELALAAVLAAAGAAKLADARLTGVSIGRLLPQGRKPPTRWLVGAAIVLGASEIALAVALLLWPSVATSGVALVLTVGFVGVVTVARRRGLSCGCFGSFAVGVSGRAETMRAWTLVALAWTAFVMRLGGADTEPTWAAVALGLAGGVLAVIAIPRLGQERGPAGAALNSMNSVRLALTGQTAGTPGWRRPSPRQRWRILRAVRSDPRTVEVVDRAGFGRLQWRTATVRVADRGASGRVGLVVVNADNGRLQALWYERTPPAVIGYTPTGVVMPRDRTEATA